jgi:TolB-like protein/Tfp pilus assembly protein PilF
MAQGRIGQTLGHYRVVAKLGEGGMGEVYRAHDEHLDRDVALKVLPEGLLADERARRRFRKEALALSRLNHPYIATVHDFSTYDGTDVLVMEYVAGETMSDRLAAGAVCEEEVARLATQLVEGLIAAHAEGVLHRDLKPANLRVLPDGRLKILDFGLAALHAPPGGEEQTRTISVDGNIAGTLPYMAPEQVRAEQTDARTDIYAVGVTLYEMVTRQRPFRDTSTLRLAEAILHEPCVAPSRLARALSPPLEGIILKCLEKDPTLRYQSATDLLIDLRRLSAGRTSAPSAVAAGTIRHPGRRRRWLVAAGVAGVTLVAAALVTWRAGYLGRPETGRASVARVVRSIAVLPLENLSRDPQQEYVADGMTEALTTNLARIKALKVIARTSVMQYKATQKPVPQIGRELGVDAIVEGSVLRVGDRVRITARLVNAAAGENLWVQDYDREVRDVLQLHGEVAQAIAREVQVALTPDEQRQLTQKRQVDPVAHDAYLKGVFASSRLTPADMDRAIGYAEEAIARDPTFAEAYAGLGQACLMRSLALASGLTWEDRRQLFAKARASAELAIKADETIPHAHTVLAAIALMLDWDWPRAEQELRRALELDGNNASAQFYWALLSIVLGRREEATRSIERTVELDPLNVGTRAEAGEGSFWLRDYDKAVAFAEQALAFDPGFRRAHFVLGRVYEAQGRIVESIAEYEKWAWSAERAKAGRDAFARGGQRGFYQWQLTGLLAQGPGADTLTLARIHTSLGHVTEAIGALERAYRDREPMLFLLKTIEWFEPLHGDPRFIALARRMRLPESRGGQS